MCLSTQAILLFISMLPPEILTQEPNRITIAADTGAVEWNYLTDNWCTVAPLQARSVQN